MLENELMIDETNFERLATRVADQVFANRTDRKVNYLFKGVEFDGFYEDEFNAHYIEYTVSKKKSKISHDISKLISIMTDPSAPGSSKSKMGWIVTKHPLSPDAQDTLDKVHGVKIRHETYQEFVSRLIDSADYLSARSNHSFGSAIDPETGSYDFKGDKFVRTPLRFISGGQGKLQFDQLYRLIFRGAKRRILLTGDFGVGKSMHMREIFKKLAKDHTAGKVETFPVALNMREFAQLETPDEALRRHADRLGRKELGEQLIRAWKAGFVTLLIDGFDEMVPRSSAKDARRIQDIRRQALLVVRRFISETPPDSVIVVSGRSHYFSTIDEMNTGLGIKPDNWSHVSLEDLATDEEVRRYLAAYNANFSPPPWIPRRPLLLGYLAALAETIPGTSFEGLSPAEGWSFMLDRFCEREVSQIDTLPLVKTDLFDIYGDLAARARRRDGGVGPLTLSDLIEGYKNIFGDEPVASELGQLLRLPGLVNNGDQPLNAAASGSLTLSDSKAFVSLDFRDTCGGLYLSAYMEDRKPYRIRSFEGVKQAITPCGADILSSRLKDQAAANYFIKSISEAGPRSSAQFDALQSLVWAGRPYTGKSFTILGCEATSLDLRGVEASVAKIGFEDCYFSEILCGDLESGGLLPTFKNCLIEKVIVDRQHEELAKAFASCDVDVIILEERTEIDIQMSLKTVEEKIFYDVLRKIFKQSLSGRASKALYAGVAPHDRPKVDALISALKSGGVIYSGGSGVSGEIWRPVLGKAAEVSSYLNAPDEKFFRAYAFE